MRGEGHREAEEEARDPLVLREVRAPERRVHPRQFDQKHLQWYLAHKKQPHPLKPP